jgi:alpha-tubulin suppressor-like RCC1 family protein
LGHRNTQVTPFLNPWTPEGTTLKSVHSGAYFSLALTHDGRIFGWGSNTFLFPTEERLCLLPQEISIPSSSPISQVACGYDFAMVLTESGEVFGWGENPNGELGMYTSNEKVPSPMFNKELTQLGVQTLVCGGSHGLAIVRDRSLVVWGYNASGCLGTGDKETRFTPHTLIPAKESESFGGISEICTGNSHSIVLMRDGTIMIWGNNNYDQTGMRKSLFVPTILQLHPDGKHEGGLKEESTTEKREPKVIFIGTGMNNGFAMREDGMLFAWGLGSSGQLGVEPSMAWGATPTAIANLRFHIPPPRTEELWRQLFSWLFLGLQDCGSSFSKLNVEVIFALASVYSNS